VIGEFFEQFGEVENVNILKNPDGRSKGLAFVRFETEEG
jgi:RNA recognition motif-containing protein